ncbi:MAG: IS1/IS1595 family N-terminal zinc-binding domain-containing protein [Chroococcidiopsis sp.]
MQCPEWESKIIVKNGRRKGKQNYLCPKAIVLNVKFNLSSKAIAKN